MARAVRRAPPRPALDLIFRRIVTQTEALWHAVRALPSDAATMGAALDALRPPARVQLVDQLGTLAQRCGQIREYALQVKYAFQVDARPEEDPPR